MKLSTRKIMGIELAVVLLWLGGLLIPQTIIREYVGIGTLIIAILVSWWLLGWAKPRAREGKLVTILIALAALVFQVIWFVLLGLKLGFLQNVYLWNWQSLFNVFLPITMAIVLEEILRGQLIARGHESKFVFALTIIVFTALETIWMWPVYNLSLAQDGFNLVVITILPSLLKGCLLTYVAYEYDYRANIIYRLIMELPLYILPIVPNVSEYLTTMFSIALVLILACLMVRVHGQSAQHVSLKPERAESEQQRQWKKAVKYGAISLAVLVVVAYVGLMSGIFKYHFLAVGSGSMEPNLSRGDMVLVERSDEYDEMREGDILVYRHDNVVVVHRINKVEEVEGQYYFQTKGDANDAVDRWWVPQSDIIGIAKNKLIAAGFPTLWLNELFKGGKI